MLVNAQAPVKCIHRASRPRKQQHHSRTSNLPVPSPCYCSFTCLAVKQTQPGTRITKHQATGTSSPTRDGQGHFHTFTPSLSRLPHLTHPFTHSASCIQRLTPPAGAWGSPPPAPTLTPHHLGHLPSTATHASRHSRLTSFARHQRRRVLFCHGGHAGRAGSAAGILQAPQKKTS